jgi:hypothetical protein
MRTHQGCAATVILLVSLGALNGAQGQALPPAVASWRLNVNSAKGSSTDAGINAIVSQIDADVQRVRYDSDSVYINSTGVPSYDIGPWLDGNPAVATDRAWLFRIPLNPQEELGTKTTTPLGAIGVWVNGVPLFNAEDAHSYNNQGVWNQNAVVNEAAGMDAALGHPAPVMGGGMVGSYVVGIYHHHQQSPALRAQLGDDSSTHSPILGYGFDGFPVYGPYGFANVDGSGGVVRMRSSYQLRTGTRPSGPGGIYDGTYIEDFEYVAGSGDLDQYNGRFGVTPEYPNGIYHYHATIDASGHSAYPYAIGPQYYGAVATDDLTNSVVVPPDAIDYLVGIPVAGKRLVIKNKVPDDASKNKITVTLRDAAIRIGTPGSQDDPRVGGGEVTVRSSSSGQTMTQSLPAANWTLLGSETKPKGYKYVDKQLIDGPCKRVVVKDSRTATVRCLGKGPMPLTYDLTGVAEQPVSVRLSLGSGSLALCAAFGGQARRDGTDAKEFLATNAPAPATCP